MFSSLPSTSRKAQIHKLLRLKENLDLSCVHIRISDPGQRGTKTHQHSFIRASCIGQILIYCRCVPCVGSVLQRCHSWHSSPGTHKQDPTESEQDSKKGNIPETSFNKNGRAAFDTAAVHPVAGSMRRSELNPTADVCMRAHVCAALHGNNENVFPP